MSKVLLYKVLSIDIPTTSFRELEITDVNYMNWGVEMAYTDNGTKCLAPMFIGREEYKKLLGGHIVELHEGEVALVKID